LKVNVFIYVAYYYPWLTVADGKSSRTIPPSGHVAALIARNASVALTGVQGLSQTIGSTDSNALSARGINLIRSFPGKGILLWGARTTSQDPDYRYLPIQRLAIFLEHSITTGLQWTATETNGQPLWDEVRLTVSDFLLTIWRDGRLLGRTADEAFFVRSDQATMTVVIGFAPLRPAEFVIIQIQQFRPAPYILPRRG